MTVTFSFFLLKGKSRVADCLFALVQADVGSRSNHLNGEQTAISLGCASLGEVSGEWGGKRITCTASREPETIAPHAF